MQYGLIEKPELTHHEALIIGVLEEAPLPSFAKALNKQYHGLLDRLTKKLHHAGDIIAQTDLDGHALILIHCGKEAEFTAETLKKRMADIADYVFKNHIQSTTICVPQLAEHTPNWQMQYMLLELEALRYQLLDFKTQKKDPHLLNTVDFYLPKADKAEVPHAYKIAKSIHFTRNLANLPANICTPTYLANQAMELAQQHKHLHCTVLNRDDMETLGMGALLSVAQGSQEPPKLIELEYRGAASANPIVLVGKGITFDSGGLSLKPADGMVEMKYDMAGAASVLGVLQACALLQLPLHVVGLIACAENMPSGSASRPGDIVTSMSGQTIEILNTDAEGRLILADTLTYAERFHPKFVIDMATLTGAVIVALGPVATGVMTQDEALAKLILTAAETSQDKAWRLPLHSDYQAFIESPLADVANSTLDRAAGSITAACFLSRFTKNYRWAHLDIAGTAWVSGKERNATGRPVPLLIELLRHVADSR